MSQIWCRILLANILFGIFVPIFTVTIDLYHCFCAIMVDILQSIQSVNTGNECLPEMLLVLKETVSLCKEDIG